MEHERKHKKPKSICSFSEEAYIALRLREDRRIDAAMSSMSRYSIENVFSLEGPGKPSFKVYYEVWVRIDLSKTKLLRDQCKDLFKSHFKKRTLSRYVRREHLAVDPPLYVGWQRFLTYRFLIKPELYPKFSKYFEKKYLLFKGDLTESFKDPYLEIDC